MRKFAKWYSITSNSVYFQSHFLSLSFNHYMFIGSPTQSCESRRIPFRITMDLPPLNELYNGDSFTSPLKLHQTHTFSFQPNVDQSYLHVPRSDDNDFPPLASISSPLPSLDVHPSRQNHLMCAQCKGQKYSFTPYFHNTKIFPKPPHELLHWVERSYVLKNRLQSLLVTYAVHEVELDHVPSIGEEVNTWCTQVDSLAQEVWNFPSGSELVANLVRAVHEWTKAMMTQFWEHVRGIQMLPMPKGRVKELVLEFRKLWERVWIACAEQQG